jgi:hypothetical protein
MRRAASLAACTAGRSKPTKTPMMAITTSNSTRVNPFDFFNTTSLRKNRDINEDPLRRGNEVEMIEMVTVHVPYVTF